MEEEERFVCSGVDGVREPQFGSKGRVYAIIADGSIGAGRKWA